MLLTLDTSAAVSVALTDGGDLRAARHRYDPRQHAELLAPFVEQVLTEARVGADAITAVAVGQGPGPFTGLRVALVTARVMAATLGVPVHGLASLDGLALAASRTLALAAGDELIAATDARRREVYWARYRADEGGRVVRLTGPSVARAESITVDGAVCVGRGTLLYPDALPPAAAHEGLLDPCAADLAVIAAAELADGPPRDPVPLYLRRPDATEPARA